VIPTWLTRLVRGTIAGGLLAGICIYGCGNPEQKHRVLTFFFDGVPPLGAPLAQEVSLTTLPRRGRVAVRTGPPPGKQVYNVTEHRKFKCGTCHLMTSGMSLKQEPADLCITCHEGEIRKYKFPHGPVAVAQCGACHSAHRSKHPGATWDEQPALCMRCHNEPALTEGEHHRDVELDKCTACHDPHGSENRFLLRIFNAAATQPSTQPTKNLQETRG